MGKEFPKHPVDPELCRCEGREGEVWSSHR